MSVEYRQCRTVRGNTLKIFLIALLLATVSSTAGAQQQRSEIPMLAEDRPSDFHLIEDGPWDGNWVMKTNDVDGVEAVSYFCSEMVGLHCEGREYVAPESNPSPAREGEARQSCSGSCFGTAGAKYSYRRQICSDNMDCRAGYGFLQACEEAYGEAWMAASSVCEKRGGANCVGYSALKTTGRFFQCRKSIYCRYKCTADAKGTCGPQF